MSKNITDRLRLAKCSISSNKLMIEAADEIERLRSDGRNVVPLIIVFALGVGVGALMTYHKTQLPVQSFNMETQQYEWLKRQSLCDSVLFQRQFRFLQGACTASFSLLE